MRGFRLSWVTAGLLAFSWWIFAPGVLLRAQQKARPTGAPTIATACVDETEGEDWVIGQRQEWFYGPREAGADGHMAELRAQAVEYTRALQACQKEVVSEPSQTWQSRGPFSASFLNWAFGKVSGRIACIAKDWDKNVLYVGSASGGVWKSTDDGKSWTSIFDSAGTQTIGALALDPKAPDTIWAGTGENPVGCRRYFGIGLLKTTNGGGAWTLMNGTDPNAKLDLSTFCGISIDPRDSKTLVVAGKTSDCASGTIYTGGVYVTKDGGSTWARTLTGAVTSLVRDSANPDKLWAGVSGDGVFRSLDAGQTWVVQTGGGLPSTGASGRVEVAVSPSDGKYVYALFQVNATSDQPEFWRTTNGDSDAPTWSLMSSGTDACDGQCYYNMTVRTDVTNPSTVYRGNLQIYKSTDGGANWENLTGDWNKNQKVHQDTHFFLMNPSNALEFYVGCDGGIWKSQDGGSTFLNLNGDLNLTQFYYVGIHPTDDDILVGGCQDNSSMGRKNGGAWAVQYVTGDGFISGIDPDDTDYVYIASYPRDSGYGGYPKVLRSSQGMFGDGIFESVTDAGCGIKPTSRINWVTPYAMDSTDPKTLYLGTYRMYKSTNRGGDWKAVGPTDMTSGGSAKLIVVKPGPPKSKRVYAGTSDGRAWRSKDQGKEWTEVSEGLPDRTVADICADPQEPDRAFAVVQGFNTAHFYVLEGTSWTAKGTGLPNIPADCVLAVSSSEIYVGTDVGAFRSTDGGATFEPFSAGLPQGLVVQTLVYNTKTKTLTMGSYGRGAWQVSLKK